MNSLPSPQAAALELIRRDDAANSLLAFTKYTNPSYQPAPHHVQICEKLEAVERGDIDRLMIFMPPRHGKSELASRRFPAWYVGRNPTKQIITASYSSDLASDFGREVRNIMSDVDYQRIFDVRLAEDARAAGRWSTNQGGVYVAAGVGAGITGKGAHVALIDDPIKDRMEADSEVTRQRIWDWYSSTLYTRLMPGGAVILVQTRWHDDDLAGRLLQAAESGGDQWDVLELPAISGSGEALWPAWYPLDALERIRSVTIPRDWSALYQQQPVPDEGTYFKRDWFKWYDEPPERLRYYMGGDFAVSEGGGDFTELGVVGISDDDDMYIVDWWNGQTTTDVWIDALLSLADQYEPNMFISEMGVIRKAIEPFLKKRSRERQVYIACEWMPHIGDKSANARAFQGRASQGKVYLPRNEIGERILNQLLRFPAGTYDDIVDVLGLIGRYLQQMAKPSVPQTAPEVQTDAWGRKRQADSWKTM